MRNLQFSTDDREVAAVSRKCSWSLVVSSRYTAEVQRTETWQILQLVQTAVIMTEINTLLKRVMVLIAGEALVHHLLSVSLASSPDDDVVFTNVAGFIVM